MKKHLQMTDMLRSVLLLYNSGLLMNNTFAQRPVAPMLLYLCIVHRQPSYNTITMGDNPFSETPNGMQKSEA